MALRVAVPEATTRDLEIAAAVCDAPNMPTHLLKNMVAVALGAALVVGCSARTTTPLDVPGARVAIAIAPLDLPAVADAAYTITVRNGADPAEIVWTRDVTST
ncbi:MAG: hypothetical protein CVV17_07215, partial [Gammaproteobacteria bacterium HGW-Gammaproteobacteria-7]